MGTRNNGEGGKVKMDTYMSIHCDILESAKEEGFKKTIEYTDEDGHQNEATFSEGLIETETGNSPSSPVEKERHPVLSLNSIFPVSKLRKIILAQFLHILAMR